MTIPPVCLGIDVSKAVLDVFDPRCGLSRVANDVEAIETFVARLDPSVFVVFEATGRYDARLRRALEARGLRFARVNPEQARAFARATGRRAKTDAVDARMLADLGRRLAPSPAETEDPVRVELALLDRRRAQLVAMRATERVRLADCDDDTLHTDLAAHIAFLDAAIDAVADRIAATVRADERLARLARRLESVPGVGPVVAARLLATLPELGRRSPKTIASLAGLAPHADDSGGRRGKRVITGGRRRIREALYMAAVAASRGKTRLGAFYRALLDAGKPPKLALLALARKLVVILNAVARDDQEFRFA